MRQAAILTLLLTTAITLASASMVRAQNGICQRLWLERNSIYKVRGYCFKTPAAISYFGNAGCMYDDERDVPLSPYERRRISDITAQERAYGCR